MPRDSRCSAFQITDFSCVWYCRAWTYPACATYAERAIFTSPPARLRHLRPPHHPWLIDRAQPPLILTSALQYRKNISGIGSQHPRTPDWIELDNGPPALVDQAHIHHERGRNRDVGT